MFQLTQTMHFPSIYTFFSNSKTSAISQAMAMASLPCLPFFNLLSLSLFSILPTSISQNPFSPSTPTIAQCTTSLLPLASCAPFVQGITPSPAFPCCDNLKQLYISVPQCLCLLLNGTTLSAFPINITRALELPDLCSLQVNFSTCSGVLVPPGSPNSQVSPGSNANSTVANATVSASPMDQPGPRPSIIGFGMGRTSASFKLRMGTEFAVAVVMKTFLSLLILY